MFVLSTRNDARLHESMLRASCEIYAEFTRSSRVSVLADMQNRGMPTTIWQAAAPGLRRAMRLALISRSATTRSGCDNSTGIHANQNRFPVGAGALLYDCRMQRNTFVASAFVVFAQTQCRSRFEIDILPSQVKDLTNPPTR